MGICVTFWALFFRAYFIQTNDEPENVSIISFFDGKSSTRRRRMPKSAMGEDDVSHHR